MGGAWMSDVFDAYATYYDLLYQDKDYLKEAKFIHDLLCANNVLSDSKILELGCGTGKHAEELVRLGHRVLGVDISHAMIEIANSKKALDQSELVQFLVGDVRKVRLQEKFDSVISLFHVASYQVSNKDLLEMFKTASENLNEGGIFIFDCWYGPAVLSAKPEVRVKRIGNKSISVVRLAEPELIENDNLVHVKYTVQVKQQEGREMSEFEEVHNMRYLFKPEVEFFLELAGMKYVKAVEWLTGNEIGVDTWGATFVAKKIHQLRSENL